MGIKSFFLEYFLIFPVVVFVLVNQLAGENRCRARDIGLTVGMYQTGPWNAITDVEGVLVGQVTLVEGTGIRTGVTAILPHGGNLFKEKVAGSVYVGNGFGKLMGSTQIRELGTIETPILLTGTLNVPRVADALLDYMLDLPGMGSVRSINPVVGETNDGFLSDIRSRPVRREHVFEAVSKARSGPVEEGSVGAGTGTVCYGFKGGIGSSSRVLAEKAGGYRVGVLVQTNFGGLLEINGAPVWRELGTPPHVAASEGRDGSCMIVVATDAPLDSRNLNRLAKRAFLGMAATGSASSNGSGDYVISFTTNRKGRHLSNDEMTPLFQAAKEATEESIYNSLLMATSVEGRDGHIVPAIPIEKLKDILKKYRVIDE